MNWSLLIAFCAAFGVIAAAALSSPRLLFGPTLHDRAQAAASVATKAALVCAALAVAVGRAEILDAAFALMFGAFALNLAVLKFFRSRSFQPPLDAEALQRADR